MKVAIMALLADRKEGGGVSLKKIAKTWSFISILVPRKGKLLAIFLGLCKKKPVKVL
jgi:hypothetical protein